ncbi:MAG: hypothetical protein WC919_00740 [Candidatus Paceibacterota bacterium]|jgi:hypothetical protein
MKIISSLVFAAGLAVICTSFALELWWRCHSDTFNLFPWQAGVLLWTGTPGMILVIIGGYLISITNWSNK